MAGTNSVSTYTDDFEAYSDGEHIASTTNDVTSEWVASATSHLVATGMPVNTLPSEQHPLPDSSHTRVAKLDTEGDSVTNHLAGDSVDSVWLDMNIQMVPSDSQPTSFTNDSQVQCAVYMGTNGQLNLYHSTYDGAVFGSNQFSELSHPAMATGSWHRLTVAMDYKSAVNGWATDVKFVQVTLDGTAITDVDAWVNPADPTDGISGGTWFVCANNTTIADHINMALLSGTGYLDDFVVTNGAPDQTATTYYTNNVPSYWLSAYSLELDNSSSGALYNADNDVHPAWAEWLLGTDPTVSNTFQLMIDSEGGTNTLIWVADGTMDDNAPGITLHKSTNLLDGYSSTVDLPRTAMDAGTNEWEDTTGTGDAMYRLGVSTD
jgi:hypothetical protein